VLSGAELHALSPGHCELQLPITQKILQQNGFVRGGMISYAAANTLTYAGEPCLEWAVVTSELKSNYVSEQKLWAVAQGTIARLSVKASPT